MIALSLALGFGIGMSLGMLGGGGSILTVPALVYLVGQPPQVAVTASLAIVGANSLLGAWFHRARGTVNWRVAALFGLVGMAAAYGASGLSDALSPTLLLVVFAALMLVVGLMMLRQPARAAVSEPAGLAKIVVSAAGIGLLTGILGVGGGFLIVPALVLLIGLPVQQAIGTSLVIIAMNSVAGLLGHLGEAALDLRLVVIFVLAGLGGTYAGTRLAHRLPAPALRRAFAVFVMILAVALLYDNLPKLL